MRGKQEKQITMLSALTPDQLVPQDHPIRQIKPIVDQALSELSPTFNRMYADLGRPSIPPEHLLKASLLIALYSIRSERQFCERLQYDLLFKWFLDLNIMDPAFDASSFSKNKERLLEHQVAREFLTAVVAEARRRKLLSEDHFTVDGTLLEAWASLKSIIPGQVASRPLDTSATCGSSTRCGRGSACSRRPACRRAATRRVARRLARRVHRHRAGAIGCLARRASPRTAIGRARVAGWALRGQRRTCPARGLVFGADRLRALRADGGLGPGRRRRLGAVLRAHRRLQRRPMSARR